MTFDARVTALAEAVADAADKDSARWRALYEADHEGDDQGAWVEARRPTGHAVRRSRAEFVAHIERCLRAAVDHDDYRLLPPYLIEKDGAGTGIRIARDRAMDFRRRLEGLGLTLPGRGRSGPNMLTAMLGEVLEGDPDAPMERVIELLRRLFPDRIDIEPGVRVRWRPAQPQADHAADYWDREKPWRAFQQAVSRARTVAQAERDSWPS